MTASGEHRVNGALAPVEWDLLFFASPLDPRQDAGAWRRGGERTGVRASAPALDLVFGGGGPGRVGLGGGTSADLPADHFGTIATTTVEFPAGTWRLRTVSDDGIRVWLGDELVIDDWTWHAPRSHTHEFILDEPRALPIRVEHFELDGYAVLSLSIEPG